MTAGNTGRIAAHFVRARWRWATLRGPALRHYQERHARRIVAYTRQHSPFYRAHWAGHDLRRWRSLPTVDKRLMMAHFDGFNTVGIRREAAMVLALHAERERDFTPTLGGYTVGLSSGTSGHRGLFIASAWEQAAWAGTILARTVHRLGQRLRVAFFLRSNSNLYEQVGGALVQFRFFDLMTPLDEAVASLNAFAPQVIVGPASLLALLAAARQQGTLRAQPRRLIAVAEVLELEDRATLESAFSVQVEQIYQCTEGLLAISCAAGSLHIQEDLVALQLERLPGDAGRVTPIVTDLWRRTQPIIRYRLNDVLQMDPCPCRCGSDFRVIRAIEGRCDDLCLFVSRDGSLRPFFADTIRRMILLAHPAISDYQAVQEQPGALRIHLDIAPGVPFAGVAAALRASVDATVAGYGCRPARLEIEAGVPAPAPGIKRRRVVRVAG